MSDTTSQNEAEALLASTREAVLMVGQQAESARALLADLNASSASAREAGSQAKEFTAQVAAALESVRTLASAATESASRAEALRTQIEQTAQVAAQRSEHIEEGRKYVDGRRAEVDVMLNAAQLSATNAEAQYQESKATGEKFKVLLAATQTVSASVESYAGATNALRAAAEKDAAATARLAETAAATEKRVGEYELNLSLLQAASDKQQKVIDGLLLGATNAGLASAFDQRSKTFKLPQQVWQGVFVGSLGALLVLAGAEAAWGSVGQDWAGLTRALVHRLPFLVPIVWLALYASWQSSLASRMEEEYAFKATISTSFEGYRRQMADVGKDLAPDSPLARLCTNTLITIAQPPGRIHDKHGRAPTPGSAAAETIAPFMDSASSALTGRPSAK